MTEFTEEQRALITAAAVEKDRAFDLFAVVVSAPDPVRKLQLMEPYDASELRAIGLLRQAGDLGTDERFAQCTKRNQGPATPPRHPRHTGRCRRECGSRLRE